MAGFPTRHSAVKPVTIRRRTACGSLVAFSVVTGVGVAAVVVVGPAANPTEVPGVWVAGSIADVTAQVVARAAQGIAAGTTINVDLAFEDARVAVGETRRG